ncbi:hypothetical protein PF005_g342 [Phytophthora fragariae]|uniref:Uncharacterized protein n=1 Tax=Phytophthora fragariae TaxID=53985 RepID=A0A6A3MCZ7_9STRA|nr:hypothetical protein PF003_g12502 [Phytophthora fragariae]KAE8948763.1 hypothetical protein PF009_g1700 [Phytophthora fragariae]KAE9029412.1 hypothetical protein PF011_g1074 [Phytophthora fragariae]KAE9137797.1 hypothetical protein PF007_g1680 [Phytophthora fragariae]KAE9140107.1 hypothetical protein PF010_g310 [Phytophthora fragariae]
MAISFSLFMCPSFTCHSCCTLSSLPVPGKDRDLQGLCLTALHSSCLSFPVLCCK